MDVCPVECIYEYTGDDKAKFPNQLYIHPDECIDCGACEPECPWEAIFEDASVPGVFKDDIALNADLGNDDAKQVPARGDTESPTPEQVGENKKKWGYA